MKQWEITPGATYIGDGVYAHFDPNGSQVWAETIRANGRHEIAFGPEELKSLIEFAARCGLLPGASCPDPN